jgi:hypothetical protein
MKIAALALALWMGLVLVSALGPLWFATEGSTARIGYGPSARISNDVGRDLDEERDQEWARGASRVPSDDAVPTSSESALARF